MYDDTTEPLINGAKLPDHPANTTARKIVSLGPVRDTADSTVLTAGLHRNEMAMLRSDQRESLSHLYRYAIIDHCIYHTRHLVTVDCKTEDEPT